PLRVGLRPRAPMLLRPADVRARDRQPALVDDDARDRGRGSEPVKHRGHSRTPVEEALEIAMVRPASVRTRIDLLSLWPEPLEPGDAVRADPCNFEIRPVPAIHRVADLADGGPA